MKQILQLSIGIFQLDKGLGIHVDLTLSSVKPTNTITINFYIQKK